MVIVIGLISVLSECGNDSGYSRSNNSYYNTSRYRTTYSYTAAAAPRTTSAPSSYTYRSSTKSKKNTTKAPENDPYGAKDYADPDDFYYDHYDDFFDYEDAEDYWYENS